MGRVVVPLLSFNGGEIGARALARVDLAELYPKTAETMENCWASVQGPLSKVPGDEYFGSTPSNAVAILRPFIYNEDDALALELSDQLIRFIDPVDGFISIAGAAATIGNFTDSSDAGASVTTGSTSTTLTATDAAVAKARSTITTAESSTAATLTYTTTRRNVKVRLGTSAGGEEILADTEFAPGTHIITFTPGAGTYYFQVSLDVAGSATLGSLTRRAAGVLTLATPWAEADLPLLRYEQQRDAMWWYLGAEQTRVLERRGTASWSLRLFEPEDGPFDSTNVSDVTLTPSALEGTATLTASQAMFSSADVGRLIGLTHQGQSISKSFTGAGQTSDPIRVTGVDNDRVFSIAITGTWVGTITLQRSVGNDIDFADYGTAYTANTSVQIDDGLDNQIIYYRWSMSAYTSGTATATITYARGSTTGYARVYQYTSTTVVGVDVLVDFGKTTATTEWALGAWSDGEGWPVAGTLFDGRHWLARQDRVFGSVADDYESFAIGTDASAAVDRFIATGDVNDARWVEGATRLLIGTSGAAVEVRASSFDEPITPDNMSARSVANRGKGAAPVQAEKMDKRIIYVGKNAKRLYQLVYDVNDNAYAPDDLTRLHKAVAGALETDGFVELAVQYEPEPRVWGLCENGELAVLTMAPEEGVYAWNRFTDDGAFYESACVLPGSPEDHVFFVVRRTINSATVRHICKLARQEWASVSAAWRLRDALAVANPVDEIISGLDHLEGEEVYAWADGRVQGPFTVTSGDITLATKAAGYDYVIVGKNYTATYKSSKLSYGGQMGSSLCQTKKLSRVGFITNQVVQDAFKFGADLDALDTWPAPDETAIDETTLDAPLVPISRDDNQPSLSGASTDPRLYIVMDQPCPVEILGAVLHIETLDR